MRIHVYYSIVPAVSLKLLLSAASVALLTICLLAPAKAANGSATYTYDALGRVTSVTYDTGVLIIYTYDANGNRTQQVINVNTTGLVWGSSTPCTNNCWGSTNWQ